MWCLMLVISIFHFSPQITNRFETKFWRHKRIGTTTLNPNLFRQGNLYSGYILGPWEVSSENMYKKSRLTFLCLMDVYKTLTPGAWTSPADQAHELLRRPSSWTTPVDHLLFFKMNFKVRVRFSRTLMNKTVPIIYIYYQDYELLILHTCPDLWFG